MYTTTQDNTKFVITEGGAYFFLVAKGYEDELCYCPVNADGTPDNSHGLVGSVHDLQAPPAASVLTEIKALLRPNA